MTDGASGSSIDELDECVSCKKLAFWIFIGAFLALSFLSGMTTGYLTKDCPECPSEWKRAKPIELHKHGVRK